LRGRTILTSVNSLGRSCDFLWEYVDLTGGRVQGLLQIDLEALVLGAGTMVDEIEAIAGSRG
jgi:hypothetical protein